MKNQIKMYKQGSLEELILVDLVEYYNEINATLGCPPIKKFRDKTTAIRRIQKVQREYIELILPKLKKAVKKKAVKKTPKKTEIATGERGKYSMDTFFVLGEISPRVKSAMGLICDAVTPNGSTAADIISYFLENFQQPRGKSKIDYGFARGYLSGAIRAGYIVKEEEL